MWIPLLRVLGVALLGMIAIQLGVQLASLIRGWWTDVRVSRLRTQQLRLEITRLRASVREIQSAGPAWEGWRRFRVERKVAECRDCCSIYLTAEDGKPLPAFRPGQYLTFQLPIPGSDRALVRCYSLSAAPHPDVFRCTIKKVAPPITAEGTEGGRASTFLNDRVGPGDVLEVKAPKGRFHLDESDSRPVVLLAAGIGITPLFSMLSVLLARSAPPAIYLFFGVRNSQEHVFKQQLDDLRKQRAQFCLTTCYSDPLPADVQGRDYDIAGRLTLDLVKQRVPSTDCGFYVCGPSSFMESMIPQLHQWGVTADSIHTESFGPSSIKTASTDTKLADGGPGQSAGDVAVASGKVRFARSQQECDWDGTADSILELAESVGVAIEAGCRSGNCGTCQVPITGGSVGYAETPEAVVDIGCCLPCVAIPQGSIVLDA